MQREGLGGQTSQSSPREVGQSQAPIPVTSLTPQHVIRGAVTGQQVVESRSVAVTEALLTSPSGVQLLQSVVGSQRNLQLSTPSIPTSPTRQIPAPQVQVVSPEFVSVVDYISQTFARPTGVTQRQIHRSPPRTANTTASINPVNVNPVVAGSDPHAFLARQRNTPVLDSVTVQPLPNPSQQPLGTVHHHGSGTTGRKSPVRSFSKLGQGVSNVPGNKSPVSSNIQALLQEYAGSSILERNQGIRSTPLPYSRSPSRTNPLPSSPVKPTKSTMSSATTEPPSEVAELRRKTLEEKRKLLREVQTSNLERLTELYFLQQQNNMMDYHIWKKKPPDLQLTTYLKSRQLEEKIQERNINDEVKVLTSGGSNVPLSTPVAISTKLPPEVTAQLKSRDASAEDSRRSQGPAGSSAQAAESRKRSSSQAGLDEPGGERAVKLSLSGSEGTKKAETSLSVSSSTQPSLTLISATSRKFDGEEIAPSVTKIAADASDSKSTTGLSAPLRRNVSAPAVSQLQPKAAIKSPQLPPGLVRERQGTRQQSLSAVYDYTIGSQEMIVERAKQEAQVMQRIAELRKDGLWSAKRLPKVQEPPRNKTHWDYLLEEMQWLAADFAQERRWKKNAARKLVRAVAKYHQEQEAREVKAEKEEVQKLKRIAGNMAKEIKSFWANIEKVVQYKQQSRLDERRKKALDIQLDFIVGQTEKYSSWLTEGLNTSTAGSSAQGSVVSSPRSERELGADDGEFKPEDDESDDEETIDVEERQAAKAGEVSGPSEIELLQRESELPIEELLSSLQEAQAKEAQGSGVRQEEKPNQDQPDLSLKDVTARDEKAIESKDDKDFELSADEEEELADDDEETLEEQETAEGEVDHKAELNDLAAEGELSIEELLKRYAGAYDQDFDLPDSEEEEEESEEEESSQGISESSSEEEEEEEGEEDEDQDELKDVGMEYLINPEKEKEELAEKASGDSSAESGPNKEITDIAAAAQSLQPTGYTLSDTLVKTKVPFLLRHKLREYQHIGLDWLVTMLEKKLNGILADEMGLGKTIQTIALLAHLACEEACWGPHLIVVPTSVMLNWEMEFKKWCPGFKILTYFGSQKERKQKRQGWTKTNAFHVCITSYKLVIQDHQSFRRKKWKYLVLDEAQNIKNFKSQRWQTLLNFSSQRRLLLTGTPLQNNLMELWSLMHFLMPHVFQSHREFKEWFSNPLGGMIEGTQEYNEGIVRRLHKVLRPFLLRRLKSQVEKQLPQKYEHVIRCRLSKRQRFLYDDFMAQTKTKETLTTGHFMSVINVLMQLRKVCNHPDLFEPRPITSPFIMAGLLYYTASLVQRVMEYNPMEHVSLKALNLCIADLEISLPAYAAHRTCQLQTPRKLIEEIDSAPDPPQRPPKVKVKPSKLYPSSMALQAQKEARASPSLVNRPSDRASPSSVHTHGRGSPSVVRVSSPVNKGTPGSPGLTQVLVRSPSGVNLQARTPTPQGAVASQLLQGHGRPGTPPVTLTAIGNPRSPGTLTLVSQNPQPVPSGTPLQQLPGYTGAVAGNVSSQGGQRRVLLQQQQVSGVSTNGRAQLITTQPITVQLQPGSSGSPQQGGQRLLTGQIRQLPQGGIVQIIQTSGGQQIIRPAVQLTSQANLVNAQRTSSPQPQVVQRSGTSQVVLSQLQAAQQLHQSIQRQLTAQGVSPSQAQAVASQLSKVTAAQSPLSLQQRQLLLQQQQQQQQIVINAKGGSTPSTQPSSVTVVTSRPSSPSISIIQTNRNVTSPSVKTVHAASPSTSANNAISEQTVNAGSPAPKAASLASPSAKTSATAASTSQKGKVDAKEAKESREAREAKEAAEKLEKQKKAEKKRKSSPLYMESLDKLRAEERKANLSRIATFNQQRCSAKPVYGQDLFTAVSLFHTSRPGGKKRPFSSGVGLVHCHHALIGDALRRVEVTYKKTKCLRNMLHTPEDRLEQLQEITKRYTFVVPAATAPMVTMHTSHTPPSLMNQERRLHDALSTELKPKTWCLHPIENEFRMNFPELRLIQYDCGKLQTLDVLLRKLKSEGSRVLIFTQMTKMLDVLERFLNHHGYIYLRLDGTTKVEQRQVLMERFNKDARIFCFILSTRSGGIGVNLTGANAVVFYDSDWNPTMDAQAQDRCHRIGQTRDVHIYRLISEMSIEENILKKSNQKRLLIDVSIEGGNFTTAFFKKHTIRDIFDISKDADQDIAELAVEPKAIQQPEAEETMATDAQADAKADKAMSQSDLEKALARAEDETDVKAASRAHAEQDAELAEFDESIPYEGEEGKTREETSKVELELAQLDEQLTPIERYAVGYLEDTLEPITAEQLKEAEEQVEAAKRDWELGRLQALKEREEREAELEEDEVLFTYTREDSENQVHKAKSAKRKDRLKGSGDRNPKDTRQSRRNSGNRPSGSREGSRTSGSRTSSRPGSPPVVDRPTRSRSRASSGTSVGEGDLSRRTRSRTSSGSGSDRLPSPRGGDRSIRMAEREKRREEHAAESEKKREGHAIEGEKKEKRPVGRPRKKSTDETIVKSPERVLPRRKGSGSETPVVSPREGIAASLRRARSPESAVTSADGVLTTRSGRSHRRSGSVSDEKSGTGLEPVAEVTDQQVPPIDGKSEEKLVDGEMEVKQMNHLAEPCADEVERIHREVEKEPVKKVRNIFDIVDIAKHVREREKAHVSEASITVNQTHEEVRNKLKLNSRNLFADLAKKLKKTTVSDRPLPSLAEEADRCSSESTSISSLPGATINATTEDTHEENHMEVDSDTLVEINGQPDELEYGNSSSKQSEQQVLQTSENMIQSISNDVESVTQDTPSEDGSRPDTRQSNDSRPPSLDHGSRPESQTSFEEPPDLTYQQNFAFKPIEQPTDTKSQAETVDDEVRAVIDGIVNQVECAGQLESLSEKTGREEEIDTKESPSAQKESGDETNKLQAPSDHNSPSEQKLDQQPVALPVGSVTENLEMQPSVENDEKIQVHLADSHEEQKVTSEVSNTNTQTPDDVCEQEQVCDKLETGSSHEENVTKEIEVSADVPQSEEPQIMGKEAAPSSAASAVTPGEVPLKSEAFSSSSAFVQPEIPCAGNRIESENDVLSTEEADINVDISTESRNDGNSEESGDTIIEQDPDSNLTQESPDKGDGSVVNKLEHSLPQSEGFKSIDRASETQTETAKPEPQSQEEEPEKPVGDNVISEESPVEESELKDDTLMNADVPHKEEEPTDNEKTESQDDVEVSVDEGNNDESSEDEVMDVPSPPKPTRKVREILNLALPGEKPINLDITGPSSRTRSRHTSDTVRTRSRSKPSSSPNIPLRSSGKSSRSTTKKLSDSGPSAKRSPRLSASDSSLQTRMRRALRSADSS